MQFVLDVPPKTWFRIETAGDIYSPRVLFSFAALALLPWVAGLVQGAWQRSVRTSA